MTVTRSIKYQRSSIVICLEGYGKTYLRQNPLLSPPHDLHYPYLTFQELCSRDFVDGSAGDARYLEAVLEAAQQPGVILIDEGRDVIDGLVDNRFHFVLVYPSRARVEAYEEFFDFENTAGHTATSSQDTIRRRIAKLDQYTFRTAFPDFDPYATPAANLFGARLELADGEWLKDVIPLILEAKNKRVDGPPDPLSAQFSVPLHPLNPIFQQVQSSNDAREWRTSFWIFPFSRSTIHLSSPASYSDNQCGPANACCSKSSNPRKAKSPHPIFKSKLHHSLSRFLLTALLFTTLYVAYLAYSLHHERTSWYAANPPARLEALQNLSDSSTWIESGTLSAWIPIPFTKWIAKLGMSNPASKQVSEELLRGVEVLVQAERFVRKSGPAGKYSQRLARFGPVGEDATGAIESEID